MCFVLLVMLQPNQVRQDLEDVRSKNTHLALGCLKTNEIVMPMPVQSNEKSIESYYFVSSTKNSHVLVLIAGYNKNPPSFALPQDANNPWLATGSYQHSNAKILDGMFNNLMEHVHSFAAYTLDDDIWETDHGNGGLILAHGSWINLQPCEWICPTNGKRRFQFTANDQNLLVNPANGNFWMEVNKNYHFNIGLTQQ
jgi:hypothetical protein